MPDAGQNATTSEGVESQREPEFCSSVATRKPSIIPILLCH